MLQKQRYENMLTLLEILAIYVMIELFMNKINYNLERVFSNIISSPNNINQFIFDCEIRLISRIISPLHIQCYGENYLASLAISRLSLICLIFLIFLIYLIYLIFLIYL